jgi:protein TonB
MSQFKVLKSSHDLFTNAVKQALTGMRFYPAEIGGRKVKQLVQQPFNFTLTR